MNTGETVKQNALLLHQVNNTYVDLYNSFFAQKVFKTYDYNSALEILSKLDEQLNDYSRQMSNALLDSDQQYTELITVLNYYCDNLRNSTHLMRKVHQELKEKAEGDLSSYSFNQYNSDIKRLGELEQEKGQIGLQINKLYDSAFGIKQERREQENSGNDFYTYEAKSVEKQSNDTLLKDNVKQQTIHGLNYHISSPLYLKVRLVKGLYRNIEDTVSIIIESSCLLPDVLGFISFLVLAFLHGVSTPWYYFDVICILIYTFGIINRYSLFLYKNPIIPLVCMIYEFFHAKFLDKVIIILISHFVLGNVYIGICYILGTVILNFFFPFDRNVTFNDKVVSYVYGFSSKDISSRDDSIHNQNYNQKTETHESISPNLMNKPVGSYSKPKTQGNSLVILVIVFIILGVIAYFKVMDNEYYYSSSNISDSKSNTVVNKDMKTSVPQMTPKPTVIPKEEKLYTVASYFGDSVYLDICSIYPEWGLYTDRNIFCTGYICRCKTKNDETVWVYLTADQYRKYIDSSINISSLSLNSEQFKMVNYSPEARLHGVVRETDTISKEIRKEIISVKVIDFSSIDIPEQKKGIIVSAKPTPNTKPTFTDFPIFDADASVTLKPTNTVSTLPSSVQQSIDAWNWTIENYKKTYTCTANKVNIREKPDMNARSKGMLMKGDTVTLLERLGEWSRVYTKYGEGYIKSQYLE